MAGTRRTRTRTRTGTTATTTTRQSGSRDRGLPAGGFVSLVWAMMLALSLARVAATDSREGESLAANPNDDKARHSSSHSHSHRNRSANSLLKDHARLARGEMVCENRPEERGKSAVYCVFRFDDAEDEDEDRPRDKGVGHERTKTVFTDCPGASGGGLCIKAAVSREAAAIFPHQTAAAENGIAKATANKEVDRRRASRSVTHRPEPPGGGAKDGEPLVATATVTVTSSSSTRQTGGSATRRSTETASGAKASPKQQQSVRKEATDKKPPKRKAVPSTGTFAATIPNAQTAPKQEHGTGKEQQAPVAKKEPRSTTISVGEATYTAPYEPQYGIAVGDVLSDYATLESELNADGRTIDQPTIELVDWYMELGHAHLEDAEYGVHFENMATINYRQEVYTQHPKQYHVQLAIQAYQKAHTALWSLGRTHNDDDDKNNNNKNDDDNDESREDRVVRMQYESTLEFSFGEAYSDLAEANDNDRAYAEKALASYRKAQTSYESLRYNYAKFGVERQQQQQQQRYNPSFEDDVFNEERYYSIENGYAISCYELAMALYQDLILTENEEIRKASDKAMELVESQLGLNEDATEDEIMEALLSQTTSGGMGGAGATSSFVSIPLDIGDDELQDLFGAGTGRFSEAKEASLLEIEGFLDTAILTFLQHADYPPSGDGARSGGVFHGQTPPKKKKIVVVNGKREKSQEELRAEERLFHWRASLATAYQNSARIATVRNHHIRARELTNKALELYTKVVVPYYEETERGSGKGSKARENARQFVSSSMASTMTKEYAKTSIGELKKSLAATALYLGNYSESIGQYNKAMTYYQRNHLTPSPDGMYNTLEGDDVGMHQYREIVATYQKELEEYRGNVRAMYVYKDDSYEAGVLLALASMTMAMGDLPVTIRSYEEAIEIYDRIQSNPDRKTRLGLASAHSGLSSALFFSRRFAHSGHHYGKALGHFRSVYGEGTPPQEEAELAIEDMKDELIQAYGEEYYESLYAQYTAMGGGKGGAGPSGSGSGADGPGVSGNFDLVGYHNATFAAEESVAAAAGGDDSDDDDDAHRAHSGEL